MSLDTLVADLAWQVALIAGVIFVSGFGLGALAYHIVWGRKIHKT